MADRYKTAGRQDREDQRRQDQDGQQRGVQQSTQEQRGMPQGRQGAQAPSAMPAGRRVAPPIETQSGDRYPVPGGRGTSREAVGAAAIAALGALADQLTPRMTQERIQEAIATLDRYRAGKAALDRRIVDNQQWYRLRHWSSLRKSANPNDPEPASAWLLNSIANKHADAMDNFPEPVVLPREASDRQAAQLVSEILPVVLEHNQFEDAYSQMWWRKLKTGTGVYGVFWSPSKLNGLGDVEVRAVDLLNLYWEPGVRDIQHSRNVFCVELRDNDLLLARYPQLAGKLGGVGTEVRQYIHDESIDTSTKSAVVDWYYKTGGRLHFCKFVNGVCLYASEDDPAYRERGFYDHGQYPFVLDVLFPDEDSPAGFGYLDICKDPQMRIDKLNQVIAKNAVMAARPRFFIKGDGGINEAEFADWEKDFVHYTSGGAPADNIMPIETKNISGAVLTVLENTIDELKETSGNRDFSQGGTTSGVTAASAIAALQEAGSKLSRDMIKASYRAFAQVCNLALELIRQFYTEPRFFRVVGANGAEDYISFDNRLLVARPQGKAFGVDLGQRVPVFDISVKAQKASPFSTAAQNEMAKEFYSAGFFHPQMADQALACLDMMTFEGKEQVVERIAQNGTLYQQVMALQQQMAKMAMIIDAQNGTTIAGGLSQDAARNAQGKPNNAAGSRPVAVNPLGEASRPNIDANTARERATRTTEAGR